jgi:hypothetical protein
VLVDASVARSFGVLGWSAHLVYLCGGTVLVADGVHGEHPEDPSELRRIRNALQRAAERALGGSGLASRALAALHGLDELLSLGPPELTVLALDADELQSAVRLQSLREEDREWRRSMGARARRLDAGESASIAIASRRSLAFASDDEDALILWEALTSTPGRRTRDLFWRLVDDGRVGEQDAKAAYNLLQTDDLHNLGGPPW